MRLSVSLLFVIALAAAAPVWAGPRFPLETRGAVIVDQTGARVQLKSVNWFGAESAEFVVGGLDKQPLTKLAKTIRQTGFNSVRLPWSNQMVETNPLVEARYLAANPKLRGKRALQVFDAVIDALGREGLMVVIDNHRSRADWCCDEAHGDGLWHTAAYPERAWLADWRFMAKRYADRPFVIGAELRNEIRPDPGMGLKPSWGDGVASTDWRAAATRGGEAVLAVNPRLLIFIGALDYQTHLTPVRDKPIVLSVAHRLVYVAHDYAWDRTARELADPAAFAAGSMTRWDFVRQPGQAWTAPVYVSEWGGCTQAGPDGMPCKPDRLAYPAAFARYAADSGIDWAWWPLNGAQSGGYNRVAGAVEPYGFLDPSWTRPADPALAAALFGGKP